MLKPHEIGGGRIVKGGCSIGRVGKTFTGDELRAMRNLRPLIDTRFLEVWPVGSKTPAANTNGQRFIVNLGFGKFDVVEGVKLNAEPITKAEAQALAGVTEETNAA